MKVSFGSGRELTTVSGRRQTKKKKELEKLREGRTNGQNIVELLFWRNV